jgi:hypothetical protein
MKGSDKQIEWATKIKDRIIQMCDFALAQIENESIPESQKASGRAIWNKYKYLAMQEESASFFIDSFKNITHSGYDDMQKRAKYFTSAIMISADVRMKNWKK